MWFQCTNISETYSGMFGVFEPPNNHCQPENVLLNFVAVEASRHISFLMSDVLCNMNLILKAHEALNIIPLFTRYTAVNDT